ncbi:YihY/virulence factor BrkB family protein [Halanaeroarchaeum sulfurireducens]|uniref:YihY/virulence factor BrkB family protein n=1 Tax=Halanaeroarchaeum sulfurireducens TaxID=1604004 RepID=UPI0009AE3140|nr:YihY/virulence factor BrkB family protein [Halanaeroarchaeum sulfurireducens]
MSRQESTWSTIRAIVDALRRNQITFLAAAIAYYGFLSIIPLILLAISLGRALGVDISDAVLAIAGDFLTPAGKAAIASAVDAGGGAGSITLVGVGVLVWSSLRVFRGMDLAFSTVYGFHGSKSLADQVVDAVMVLAAIPVIVVAIVGLGGVLPAMHLGPISTILGPVGLAVTLTVAFVPVFYTFPDTDVTVREILPGTVLAALGWTTLVTVFTIYAGFVPSFRLYGVLGAALLLVTWLYVGGIIIMVGAVVNAVLGGRIDEDVDGTDEDVDRPDPAPDVAAIGREVAELRDDLDEKTVTKADLERDLERYVRRKLRRGKARGWGPYLVLLYGTAMTLGAFFWLDGGWAILAMVVVWLSTLGLYALMVLFGLGVAAASAPGSILDRIRDRRS